MTEDGTYIESCFKEDKQCGHMLVVKDDGSYFEGVRKPEDGFVGTFRNPGKKRTSMLAKYPNRSKEMFYGN